MQTKRKSSGAEVLTPKGDRNGERARPEERPIWEVVAGLGAEIPLEEWDAVPNDGSINYRHYLHGAPRQQ